MKTPLCFFLALMLTSCATNETGATKAVKGSKAYVAGDAFPSMEGRATELVPGTLPARVRYHFADNETVNHLAAVLESALKNGDASLYETVVMVQPGAWKHLENSIVLDIKEAAHLTLLDPNAGTSGGLKGSLQGRVFRSLHAMELLSGELTKRLKDDGGFRIRALRSGEMAKWWIYIGFDIEEPTYVVESTGGRYRFVISMNHGKLFAIDELNSLAKPI